ncbi:unnamed protein product [Lepidochelys kempii]
MSFSATILFSPPAPCAPISVSGHGLAVQSSEQLLHVIYQRLDKAVGLAEAALALAKANNQALQRLEEEVLEEQPPLEDPLQRVVVPAFPTTPSPSPQPVGEPSPSGSEEPPPCTALENGSPGEPRFSLGFTSGPCRSRGSGPKNSRRKRDLVLSKLVHNVHNNITNQRRFNGSESIKSSWNIGVVKFLLEKLRHELVTSQHNYTDKELKGAS